MRAILRFFAREHLLGNLLTFLILGMGIYTLSSIRRDIWPNVQFNITSVGAFLGGASPEQVEKLVTNPIEEALREVDGLKKVQSTATKSKSVTIIQLDPDARNTEKTNADIRQAIDQIQDFPNEVESPIVTSIEAGQNPVIEVTVSSQKASPAELRRAAKDLSDELTLLSEVARVRKKGYLKRELIVEADPKALNQRLVSLNQLINSIRQRNVSLPGGTIETSEGLEFLVRTDGEVSRPEELGQIVLQTNASGFGTTLKEVAKITEGFTKPDTSYKSNGSPSLNLVVSKKVNADTFSLIESVKSKVDEYRVRYKNLIDFGYSNDFSVYLSNRITALSSNLLIGLVLVMLVLAIFLPWQVTLVVAAGMPVAILATLITIHMFGLSINLINLIGLIIVSGMLVDDAIVVSENIWRHAEQGADIVTAVVDGGREVFGPVLASILTTVSAFGPMLFMTGIFGAFVFEIPLMVIIALGFSLFEAYIIMPSHFTSWVGGSSKKQERSEASPKKEPKLLERLIEKYARYVRWSIRRRYLSVSMVALLLGGTGVLLGVTGRFILFPPEGIEIFFVQVEAPTGTALHKMEKLVIPVEKAISEIDSGELRDYVTEVGIIQQDAQDPQTRRGSHFANIRVSLTPQSRRSREASEIVKELKERIGEPEGILTINYEYARQGPPQGRPISLNVLGKDFDQLNKIAGLIKRDLEAVGGVIEIRNSFVPGNREWTVQPRFQDTAAVGLNANEIALNVRAAFEGVIASSVRELDEEVDIRVKLQPRLQSQPTAEDLFEGVSIGNRFGNLIPLSKVADFKEEPSLSSISHFKGKRVINVSAEVEVDKTTASEVVSQIRQKMADLVKANPGYEIEFGGEDEDTQESMNALGTAFLFAFFIIAALLIVTFKSLLQPLLILTAIPLGFMGVAFSMFLHNRPFSFLAMLGVIALAGVIVNNSIVFIDFVNSERKKGIDRFESIISAARTRIRPILLTTITTVCGLMPTAYGEQIYKIFGFGGGDPFIVPIALSLGWGLAFGSTLTALFFPAFISVLDDIESLFRSKKSAENL